MVTIFDASSEHCLICHNRHECAQQLGRSKEGLLSPNLQWLRVAQSNVGVRCLPDILNQASNQWSSGKDWPGRVSARHSGHLLVCSSSPWSPLGSMEHLPLSFMFEMFPSSNIPVWTDQDHYQASVALADELIISIRWGGCANQSTPCY